MLAQWQYLELQARLNWLITYQPHFENQERGVGPLRQSLVGTLVNDALQMESLHRAGIPVWLHSPQELFSHYISNSLPFPSYGSDEEPVIPM